MGGGEGGREGTRLRQGRGAGPNETFYLSPALTPTPKPVPEGEGEALGPHNGVLLNLRQ